MPDFARMVQRKLRGWECPQREEVIEELAGHLRDVYEEQLRAGSSTYTAARIALRSAGNWKHLRSGIRDARRGIMRNGTKRILIPGAAALLIATVGERVLWHVGVGTPHVYQYWSWLTTTLPMIGVMIAAGAVAAAGSSYLGGSKRQRLWAVEFPAFAALVLFLTLLFAHQASQVIRGQASDWHLIGNAALRYLLFGIAVPAAALLAGGLPFLLIKGKDSGIESPVR